MISRNKPWPEFGWNIKHPVHGHFIEQNIQDILNAHGKTKEQMEAQGWTFEPRERREQKFNK